MDDLFDLCTHETLNSLVIEKWGKTKTLLNNLKLFYNNILILYNPTHSPIHSRSFDFCTVALIQNHPALSFVFLSISLFAYLYICLSVYLCINLSPLYSIEILWRGIINGIFWVFIKYCEFPKTFNHFLNSGTHSVQTGAIFPSVSVFVH